MKKLMIACLAGLVFVPAFAAEKQPAKNKDGKVYAKWTPEVLAAYRMEKFGGYLRDTRKQKGKAVVVNCQKAADTAWLDSVARTFADGLKMSIVTATGEFNLAKPALQGEATLFVIDDPALPMSLVAPESKWAMVNVAKVKCDKPAFFEQRVRKIVTRGIAYLLGAGDSQYPMCLTGCVTKPEDLDRFTDCRLPMDLMARFEKYAAGYGITPYAMTTYKEAVTQGWAHQPTNEQQKAIWDSIHTLPTKPLVIKPETK